MSAFDLLLAGSSGSATPSGSSSTVHGPPGCKAQEQFGDLSRRRENALRDVKGTARWWKFVIRKVVPNSHETIAAELRCILCQTELSTSNHYHSHFSDEHCSKIKASPELALELLATFNKAADNAAPKTAQRQQRNRLCSSLTISAKQANL